MDMNLVLIMIAMIAYLLIILGVGFYFAKRSNTSSEDYFLGGRKLGPWVTAMSAEASDMSGWLLLGLPGLAFATGASEAVWTAIGLALGTWLNWFFVAKRLRKYSQAAGNSVTLPDFFSNRFHDDKRILMSVAALIILLFFSIYVGSCFVATGTLLNSLFGWPYITMMIVGAVFVFAYTTLGGFLAESVSDLIQGFVMFFSLVIVLVGGVIMVGGVDTVIGVLSQFPGFLDLTHQAVPLTAAGSDMQVIQAGQPQFDVPREFGFLPIASTLAWGLGYFGMPQVLLRFMAIRSSRELTKSRRIAVVWCVISLAAAVSIGLIGRALFLDPAGLNTPGNGETIFITLSTLILPAFVAGITMSGIIAATMSSADSYMLIASSAISRNIFKGLFKRDASDRQVMIAARLTMCVLLVFGIIVAFDENSTIFDVVSYAWAGFGAAFGPLVLASLFWRRTNLPGAVCGMIAGGAMVLVWHNLIAPLASMGGAFALLGIYELLPAFIFGLLVLVVVSLLTKPPSEQITDEFDNYMRLEV